jgi:hypothetical protein
MITGSGPERAADFAPAEKSAGICVTCGSSMEFRVIGIGWLTANIGRRKRLTAGMKSIPNRTGEP